jgi:signal transduction histidine kinase
MGVLIVAVTVLAAAWMAGRSMHRELGAARLQADFVAAVSHEFRTPLAAFGQITELRRF